MQPYACTHAQFLLLKGFSIQVSIETHTHIFHACQTLYLHFSCVVCRILYEGSSQANVDSDQQESCDRLALLGTCDVCISTPDLLFCHEVFL